MSDFKYIKAIPFHILLIRSLAEDFNNQNISWKDLYAKIFILNSDIYKEFIKLLKNIDIEKNDIINLKKITKQTAKFIVSFKVNLLKKVIINTINLQESHFEKNNYKVALSKLGYFIID